MRKTTTKPEVSATELLARQEKELAEFIKDNPTDAALWPDPFEMFEEVRRKKPGRRRFDMEENKANCIGHNFVISCHACNCRCMAECIDDMDGQPKRMRILSSGLCAGKVLKPSQYRVIDAHPDCGD